jgi:hypothetical protein
LKISKDATYKNTTLFNSFDKAAKKFKELECEVNFETMYNLKKVGVDIIRVWFPGDLYGKSITIRDNKMYVNDIDDMKNDVVELKENSDICNLLMDLIVNDKRHKK